MCEAPATLLPVCDASPGSMSRGPKPRNCSAAGAVFERFLPFLKLALRRVILYKRGLIGILSLRRGALAARFGTMPPDNTLEDTEMAVPRRKTSPSRRGMRRSADALKKPTY